MTERNSRTPFVFNAATVARAHTWLAYAAFGSALALGCLLHFKKIVKNGVAGYPHEWFPSVSATIGDWYPERNVFQILIALTSGPRFALVALQYHLHRNSGLAKAVFISGVVRTLSCGGWVYITSSDDHDVHDICMITYILCNVPWMLGTINCTQNPVVRQQRRRVAAAFFVSIIPLVYFFIQHKVHRIRGAYTRYAFFEWGLIFFDVLYDSLSEKEFSDASLQITLDSFVPASSTRRTDNDEIHARSSVKGTVTATHNLKPTSTFSSFSVEKALNSTSLSFVTDAYLSYIFWSIFTSLIPTLFYFSVWELGIAGHELAFTTVLSPFLFAFLPEGVPESLLHILSFSGLSAYALPRPFQRLLVVGFASIVSVLRQTLAWARGEPSYQAVVTSIGLMLSSLSKHANYSNNPIWPSVNETTGGWNKLGLVAAFLCVLQTLIRSPIVPVLERPRAPHGHISLLSSALPLGSILFMLHTVFSDPSTVIAWSWTGYENGQPKGPLPHMHGAITLIAQAVGVMLAMFYPAERRMNKVENGLLFAYGAQCLAVLYSQKDWSGYIGGLGYAVFTMFLLPRAINHASARASRLGMARVYGTAMLVYVLLSLAGVWTVAYAFVPGGVYLRERTDLVLVAHSLCLLPLFTSSSGPSAPNELKVATKFRALIALMTICSLASLATLYRLPSGAIIPFRPGPRILRTGIWTVHFGVDNKGRDSQRSIQKVVRDLELDVVGLLETDLHRPVFGNRDLTRILVEDGYYVDLGPGPNAHTWGAVLLTKFPIINSTHHLLPSPHGELAPAIEAVLDVFGTYVTVVVSHNGQEEDELDRELQSTELARIMAAAYPRPVIFLGYVVTKPHAERPSPYKILVEDGNVHDIDEDDHDRWCEYILYRGLYRTSYARVSRGSVTDTELQVGQFVVPRHGTKVEDDSHDARYQRIKKEKLPEEYWFPMEYYGNRKKGGVNGHFYHVFDTPLYYQLPEDALV